MAKVFDMGVSAATDFGAPLKSLDSIQKASRAFAAMMAIDIPKEIKCSAEYFDRLQRSPRLATFAVEDPTFDSSECIFHSVPIRVDAEMKGCSAKMVYTNGREKVLHPPPAMVVFPDFERDDRPVRFVR